MEVQQPTLAEPIPVYPSKLLSLPLELRDMIWQLCVLAENKHSRRRNGGFDPTVNTPMLHPLRATCRAIDSEVSPHAFGLTPVSLTQKKIERFLVWLEKIGTRNRLAIRQLCPAVRYDSFDSYQPSEEALRWARVLQSLPNIRHLVIPQLVAWEAGYWLEVIAGHSITDDNPTSCPCNEVLRKALQSCPNLSSWTCDSAMLGMVNFATAAPGLQALRLNFDPYFYQGSIDLPNRCPSVRYLQLGLISEHVWWDFSNGKSGAYKPPKALWPKNLHDLPEACRDLTAQHPSGVRIIEVPDPNQELEDVMGGTDYCALLDKFPNLTYLGLECYTECGHLKSVPSGLETLALSFQGGVDMEELVQCLQVVRARCQNLSVMAIFISWNWRYHWNDDLLSISEPLLQQLKLFKEGGIQVAYFLKLSVPEDLSEDEALYDFEEDLPSDFDYGYYESWSELETPSERGEDDEEVPISIDGLSDGGIDPSREEVVLQTAQGFGNEGIGSMDRDVEAGKCPSEHVEDSPHHEGDEFEDWANEDYWALYSF